MPTAITHTLRQRLKELTLPFHTELEKMPIAVMLADGLIEKEKYADYLTKIAAIHQVLEPLIVGMSEWTHYEIDPSQRLRLPLLLADLEALGKTNILIESAVLDTPWNFATAVGAMYVLEGSTMGGQILSRKLSHILGDDGIACTRYFQAYGENSMKRWGEFCQFLDLFEAANPHSCDQVILGACAMFLMIIRDTHELS